MGWQLAPLPFILINVIELPVILVGKNINNNFAFSFMLFVDYICLLAITYTFVLKTVVNHEIKNLKNDDAYINFVKYVAII